MLISDFPIYNSPNYAQVAPLIELREATEPKHTDLTEQIKALYEELDRKDENVIFSISETAYIISSFMQGKQIWQQNWFKGGTWELVPVSSRDKRSNPNMVRGINKMQFQVSQMLEDLISSNPDYEPNDMFKSYKDEKRVKADKACWNHYEPKFYNAEFNRQQALSLITAGTSIEELVYDASAKGANVFKEIWGEVEMPTQDGRGECFSCGFSGQHDDFHQWDNPNAKNDYKDMKAEAENGSGKAQEGMADQSLAAFPQCPECGSFETDVQEPQSETVPSVIGLEQYQLGDFRVDNLEIQRTRFNVGVPPEKSTYFIDKQYFPLRKAKYLFGRDIQIPANSGSDIGLDYLHKMARIGASIGGARMELGEKPRHQQGLLVRMSLSAEELAEIDIPEGHDQDLKTVSGQKLIPGRTLADGFPDGATILAFGRMETIYGIYGNHHSQRISSAVYFAKANAGTGRGAEDLTEIQKRVNRLDAQQVAAVEGASPGFAFVEGAIDEKHVKRLHFPNVKVPIRREFFNMTKDVSNFVKQFEPLKVAPQMFAYAQDLDKLMQMTAHVVNLSGAVYGADNKTATGARILEATAQSIMIPMLEAKAHGRKGTIRNFLCSYKENFASVKRKFAISSGGNKHFSQMEISGDQIDPDVEFVVVENSMIPQNYYVRKADYLAFANVIPLLAPMGGLQQLRETDPTTLHVYSNAFNVDLGGDELDQITELCRLRMQDAFDLAEIFEGLIDRVKATAMAPQGGTQSLPAMPNAPAPAPPPLPPDQTQSLTPPAQTPNMMPNAGGDEVPNSPNNQFYDLIFEELELPIKPEEKSHNLKVDWFKDFLDTAEGITLGKEKRDLCFEFILRHKAAQRMSVIAEGAQGELDQMAASAPAAMLQAKVGQMMQAGEPQPPQPEQPAPEPPPDTLGDSVKYSDLPPEAQHGVLQKKGIDVPLNAVKAHSRMINAPKPSARPAARPKAKAKPKKK